MLQIGKHSFSLFFSVSQKEGSGLSPSGEAYERTRRTKACTGTVRRVDWLVIPWRRPYWGIGYRAKCFEARKELYEEVENRWAKVESSKVMPKNLEAVLNEREVPAKKTWRWCEACWGSMLKKKKQHSLVRGVAISRTNFQGGRGLSG